MDDNKISFDTNTIFSIVGKGQNKDYLVYYLISKFYKLGYNLGTILGNSYPYIHYFSDNIYIRYDDTVFSNYLENLKNMYKNTVIYKDNVPSSEMEKNLLIIDTYYLNLNTTDWLYFLENNKKYNTTILFVIDKINQSNVELLKKYTDYVYILKPETNGKSDTRYVNEFIKRCYNTFGKTIEYEIFIDFYNQSVNKNNMLFIMNKNDKEMDSFYNQVFYREIQDYFFNTKEMYNYKDKYSNICKIKDILKGL